MIQITDAAYATRYILGHTFVTTKKRKTVFIWVFGIISFAFLTGYAIRQDKKDADKEAAYRSTLTPTRLAELDREHGDLTLALQDLDVVNQDSPEYDKAQSLKSEIQSEIQTKQPQIENPKQPRVEAAKGNCRKLVKDQEEFPSTVSSAFFGTDVRADKDTETIAATVDYTAKNSTGADLPYRMTCTTDYDGKILSSYRTGR